MSQCFCSRVGKKERVFWALFGLGVSAALMYEWVLAITDFVATPQRSRMSYQEMERLDLPNLLLCAHDPLNYSALRNVGVPDSGVNSFQQYLYPHLVAKVDSQSSQPNQSSQAVDSLLKAYQGQRYKLLSDFHLKCESVVAGCQLGSSSYLWPQDCCQNSSVKLMPFGACILLSTPEQSTLGVSGSYVVDVNIRAADMRNQQGTNFDGFSVYLAESGRWPLNSAFNVLDNGASYEVKLTPLFFRQTNWWKCDWNLERFDADYPYEYELMNCTNNAVMAECRCYPFQQLMFNSQDEPQLCPNDMNSINCMNRTLSAFTNYNQNLEKYLNDHYYRQNHVCSFKIYPPCRWSKYQTSITQRKISTQSSTSSNAFTTRIILYYESFDSLFIDQFYSPNYHDIIIQIGGALTFWFVVTLICVLFVDCIKFLLGKNQVSSSNQDEQPNTASTTAAQNGSRFRSFKRKSRQQRRAEDQEQGQIMEQQQQQQSPPPPVPLPTPQLPPISQSSMMQPQGQLVQVVQMDANGQPQYHQVILPPQYQLGSMMPAQDLRLMAPAPLPPIPSGSEVEQSEPPTN